MENKTVVTTTQKIDSSSEQQTQKNVVQLMGVHAFSGPLPPPEHLERYEKLLPGITDRLLTIAEKQSDNRIQTERGVVDNVIRQKWFKYISAVVAMFLLIALGAYLAIKGLVWLAGIILTTTLLGVLAIFVLGQIPSNKKQ